MQWVWPDRPKEQSDFGVGTIVTIIAYGNCSLVCLIFSYQQLCKVILYEVTHYSLPIWIVV